MYTSWETMDIISWSEQCKVEAMLIYLLWVLGELSHIALADLIQQVWESLGQSQPVQDGQILTFLCGRIACPGRQATETC